MYHTNPATHPAEISVATSATGRWNPTSSILFSSDRWYRHRSMLGLAAVAVCFVAVCLLDAATVMAQQSAATRPPGHRTALIDVASIFKNLPSIKAQISKVEQDLKAFDAELQKRREELKQAASQLKTFKIGTPEYAKQEEHVANLESRIRLEMFRTKNSLSDAQAKIYFDNYQRIAEAVKVIATHNNIDLVLRFSSEEMDSEQSDSVARGVMKNVVYHDQSIDMTKTVMRYLEQQSGKTQVARGSSPAAREKR